MAYKRTLHKNALIKLVKEKRMILQRDAKERMNSVDIKYTVESLVKEGKIKRQKVKVRGSVGNLTDQYLLSTNDMKQAEILDYEKELINRPYKSPLEQNHCYKKVEKPVEQQLKKDTTEVIHNTKVVDMQEYIKVNNTNIIVKDFNSERVVTFEEIDAVHQRPIGTARRNFSTNKSRFVEGIDYFVFKGNEGRKTLIQANYTKFVELPKSKNFSYYLITETGYMMLVKSFTDDLSWEVQRQLVQSYFKVKELKDKQNNNLPITQLDLNFQGMYDMMKLFAGGISDLNDRVKVLEGTIEGFKKAITG
jgi:hypothetical protein